MATGVNWMLVGRDWDRRVVERGWILGRYRVERYGERVEEGCKRKHEVWGLLHRKHLKCLDLMQRNEGRV